MPIIHMRSKAEDIPADAVNVRKLEEYSGQKMDLWLYDSHVGLCVKEYERNGYNDSDFYMVVWNEELGKPESIEFASTRGWSYPCMGSRVDASPEVLAKYSAWEAEEARKYREARMAEEAARPARGKMLKVVKGRKVPKGTTGECIWIGDGRWGKRVGIKDAAGTAHWTAIANVEVVTGTEVTS
jgi:hypothetical protein